MSSVQFAVIVAALTVLTLYFKEFREINRILTNNLYWPTSDKVYFAYLTAAVLIVAAMLRRAF